MKKKVFYTVLASVFVFILALIFVLVNKKYRNDDSNILILTTTRPLTLAVNEILKNIPNVSVKEFTNGHLDSHSCFHDFSITTDQSVNLEKASAVILNGLSLEPFIDKIAEKNKNLKLIDSSKNVKIINSSHNVNPWIWMSVPNYMTQVGNISSELSSIFPEREKEISENTESYISNIKTKYEEWKSKFEPFKGKNVATLGNEFDYMLEDLNLVPLHLIEEHVHGQISGRTVNEVVNKVQNGNFKFYITSGEKYGFVNILKDIIPIELSIIKSYSNSYADEMQNNFKKLYEALLNDVK